MRKMVVIVVGYNDPTVFTEIVYDFFDNERKVRTKEIQGLTLKDLAHIIDAEFSAHRVIIDANAKVIYKLRTISKAVIEKGKYETAIHSSRF